MIDQQPEKAVPKRAPSYRRRGKINRLIHALQPGECLVCPPGIPKYPYQSIHYHNKEAERLQNGKEFSASIKDGIWRIHRIS
jgi:hypothetical protein